jgi:hypothetical protein
MAQVSSFAATPRLTRPQLQMGQTWDWSSGTLVCYSAPIRHSLFRLHDGRRLTTNRQTMPDNLLAIVFVHAVILFRSSRFRRI